MEWSLLNGTLLNELLLAGRDKHRSKADESDPLFPYEYGKVLYGKFSFQFSFCYRIKEVPIDLVNEESNNIEDLSVDVLSPEFNKPTANSNAVQALVSVLTIRKPSREDSRIYVCKASNDYGWAEMKIRLLVKGMSSGFQLLTTFMDSCD